MTYDLYWHGEPRLVKSYAKAYEIRYNRIELDLWKLGVYVGRANACLWDEQVKYPDEPLFKIKTEEEKQAEEFKKLQAAKSFWEVYSLHNNAKFRQGDNT